SLIWKRLFSSITLDKVEVASNSGKVREIKDHFTTLEKKNFEGTYSASKLQTFLDCPRKFYFSYIDKVFPDIQLEKDFDPMTSGTIIHEIIERFFKDDLKDEELKKLTAEIMGIYIKKK